MRAGGEVALPPGMTVRGPRAPDDYAAMNRIAQRVPGRDGRQLHHDRRADGGLLRLGRSVRAAARRDRRRARGPLERLRPIGIADDVGGVACTRSCRSSIPRWMSRRCTRRCSRSSSATRAPSRRRIAHPARCCRSTTAATRRSSTVSSVPATRRCDTATRWSSVSTICRTRRCRMANLRLPEHRRRILGGGQRGLPGHVGVHASDRGRVRALPA